MIARREVGRSTANGIAGVLPSPICTVASVALRIRLCVASSRASSGRCDSAATSGRRKLSESSSDGRSQFWLFGRFLGTAASVAAVAAGGAVFGCARLSHHHVKPAPRTIAAAPSTIHRVGDDAGGGGTIGPGGGESDRSRGRSSKAMRFALRLCLL